MEPFRDDSSLEATLRSLRPAPRPAFAAELDERAAADFPGGRHSATRRWAASALRCERCLPAASCSRPPPPPSPQWSQQPQSSPSASPGPTRPLLRNSMLRAAGSLLPPPPARHHRRSPGPAAPSGPRKSRPPLRAPAPMPLRSLTAMSNARRRSSSVPTLPTSARTRPRYSKPSTPTTASFSAPRSATVAKEKLRRSSSC